MNRCFRLSTLMVVAVFICLLGFWPEAQAQNRPASRQRPAQLDWRMKLGMPADPRLRRLVEDNAGSAEQEAAWRRSLPLHLQNLPLQILAQMPWLQSRQTKRAGVQRDFHPPAKFYRPWEKSQNHLKQAKPLSKTAAASGGAQLMPGCLSEEWVARYNEPGNLDNNAVDIAVDNDGNIYITGYVVSSSEPDYLTVKYNAAGVFQWKALYNGPANGEDGALALAVDGSGNVYVTGYSFNSDFTADYATIKYNAAGVQQWEVRYDGPANSHDVANAIAVDGSGNVYVTGNSYNADFTTDYAIIKYNAAGVQQWEARYDGPANSDDFTNALAIDGSGNVYVTGSSTNSDFTYDYATIKYDASGVQQWEARYDGPANSYDVANALAVDGSGNVYVTGHSYNADFTTDYATIKYNATGVQQWETRYNGPANSYDIASALAVDGSGNVYVTGSSSNADFTTDYATIKYDASGSQQWEMRYDGPANLNDYPPGLALDGSGNVYVTGHSYNADFTTDYATIKYDAAGMQQWEARYNGPANSNDDASAIGMDGDGNVCVTGTSFGLNNDSATIKYHGASGAELWSARYNEPSQASSDVARAIAVDGDGNVYVTGHTSAPGVDPDFQTIKYNSAGMLQWVARYDGPENGDDQALALAVDGSGNVYVTGVCAVNVGTLDFDCATIKYDAAGVEQWVARYNGSANGYDQATALALDSDGNIYVTGYSKDAATAYDYATIKYDATGAEQWVARYDGPASYDDITADLVLDNTGNVYITGYSTGSDGSYDCATIKYDAAGTEEWVARFAGPANDIDVAHALSLDGLGNVFITGESYNSGSGSDFLTIKYNALGVEQWAALYDGPSLSSDFALDLALDNGGNVYVTGESEGIGDDFATIKYNTAGMQQWVARYDGPANNEDESPSLALDNAGNVYVTGPSFGVGTRRDFATVKYDAMGVEVCVARYSSAGNFNDGPNAIAVDGDGNVYVTGAIASGAGSDLTTIKYTSVSSFNTPAGTDVEVSPEDVTTSATPVTLTFGQVTTPGNTALTTGSSGPPPPSGFMLGIPPVYYDLSTTAAFAGNIEVCIAYTGTTFADEAAIQLYHFEGGAWVNVTTSHDQTNDVICGSATSLSPFAIFEPEVINVTVDIKPGANPNIVNLKSKGVIPVAILTTVSFAATSINPLSVKLGPNEALESHGKGHSEDVDGDGDTDLVLHFKTQETGIRCGDTQAGLTGQTFSGQAIAGTDAIQTAGCGAGKALAEEEADIPEEYALWQNYPNPFNPETEIRFQLPEASHVVVKIFNTLGVEIRTLADEKRGAGYHRVRWDGKDQAGNPAASGVYLCQLRAGNFSQVRKMSLLR